MVQDIIDTHPGLKFLREAREFHSRYIKTVVARVFYDCNRSWSTKLTVPEIRRSNFLQVRNYLIIRIHISKIHYNYLFVFLISSRLSIDFKMKRILIVYMTIFHMNISTLSIVSFGILTQTMIYSLVEMILPNIMVEVNTFIFDMI